MSETIRLEPVPVENKNELRVLLDEYLEKLSEFGTFDKSYPWFDSYWQEDNRWPYWIIHDNQRIGFILVNQTSRSDYPVDYFLAEFYIIPKHRQNGFGSMAFNTVTAQHRGQWELSFFNKNAQAAGFWPKALKNIRATSLESQTHKKLTILRFSFD